LEVHVFSARLSLLSLGLCLAPSAAQAFCGTYVGSAGDTLLNRQSQVVMVHDGGRTTLTLSSDFVGAATFGMLIPVPAGFSEQDAKEISAGPVKRIDVYDAPRLVEYTCDDLHGNSLKSGCASCAGSLARGLLSGLLMDNLPALLDVAGIAPATLGIRTIEPASVAELADDLALDGFVLNEESSRVLDSYIQGGSQFVRVKVDASEDPASAMWLPPVQISYPSEMMTLPIKLGTLNAGGVQDVIVHVIGTQGEVGISNYPEVTIESECMWEDSLGGNFSQFYSELLDKAYEDNGGGAVWVKEYSWAPTSCDPCTAGGPLDEGTLRDLGFEGDPNTANVTRLHVRFDPGAVSEDLMLYPRNHNPNWQQRYISYDKALESDFPICEKGWSEDPGTCEADTGADAGWSGGLPAGWLLAGAAAFGLSRRRA
jgi:hypothetical protein